MGIAYAGGWAVIDAVTGRTAMVDSTRRDAYRSKKMLMDIYGGKYIVRKQG